jgi:hypothetical protein
MKNYDFLTTIIGGLIAVGSAVVQYVETLNGNPWNWGTFLVGVGVLLSVSSRTGQRQNDQVHFIYSDVLHSLRMQYSESC